LSVDSSSVRCTQLDMRSEQIDCSQQMKLRNRGPRITNTSDILGIYIESSQVHCHKATQSMTSLFSISL